ncbi:MAG TPA: hypothetical protein PKE66_09335, partial [Pyrinomonadaceae bacterium]|nr:hypothetical protein [Pyrinomonadaceae bacterium]
STGPSRRHTSASTSDGGWVASTTPMRSGSRRAKVRYPARTRSTAADPGGNASCHGSDFRCSGRDKRSESNISACECRRGRPKSPANYRPREPRPGLAADGRTDAAPR